MIYVLEDQKRRLLGAYASLSSALGAQMRLDQLGEESEIVEVDEEQVQKEIQEERFLLERRSK